MRDPPPVMLPLPLSGHTKGTTLEFVIRLRGPPRRCLRLSRHFAGVMEVDKPQGVWHHVHGCRNGVVYVDANYATLRVMVLRRGWKTFARAHNFMAGHVLRFKMVEVHMLFVKIFGHSGARLGCCEETSSDTESSSSSDSDKEDRAEGGGVGDSDSESPAVESEYNGSGSS
ncbi:l-ascorbate oxidase-like protein [Hordeum vulgare]|nr:l-ascorbate oxidase-like protein [Hordeum vulgare]